MYRLGQCLYFCGFAAFCLSLGHGWLWPVLFLGVALIGGLWRDRYEPLGEGVGSSSGNP